MNVTWTPTKEDQVLQCNVCGETKHHSLFERKGKQKPCTCKECKNQRERKRRNDNKDECNEKYRAYYASNKDKINETRRKYLQERRDNDPEYRLRMNLHSRLYMAVQYKRCKTMELTGCSLEELTQYIESKFITGMSWENYGEWHIDHIRPCASFNLEDIEEQKKCFHWSNLQPLWAKDNLRKGSRT